ncbi:MAG: DUF6471 domain-containing protein [Aestuariibacter sp.]
MKLILMAKDEEKKKSKAEKALDKAAAIEIKRFIKSEMALTGLTYKDLAEQLTESGRPISEQSLRNKVSKGSHRTTWYWDLMKVIKQNK